MTLRPGGISWPCTHTSLHLTSLPEPSRCGSHGRREFSFPPLPLPSGFHPGLVFSPWITGLDRKKNFQEQTEGREGIGRNASPLAQPTRR